MLVLELSLVLISIVLLSIVFEKILLQFRIKLSLPIIQMILGIILAFIVPTELHIEQYFNSELFLILFIAPLLFDESKRVSKTQLMNHMGGILSLAIGLVVAAMFAVGFAVHWFSPSIPLAAALALGAALGPTDAVAVTSLASSLKLKARQKALLSGEALINDASGVVSFQFAVAATITGAFSLADATVSFAISFFGGLGIGVLIALLIRLFFVLLGRLRLDMKSFHIIFDILTPFGVFIIAEHLHTSGILAVVATGLALTWLPEYGYVVKREILVVTDGVWNALSTSLNGIVFILLGIQLPSVILPRWEGSESVDHLIELILIVSFAVIFVRFVWLFVMELWRERKLKRNGTHEGENQKFLLFVRDILVTTLAGPKGAVTLSIIFTLPFQVDDGSAFPARADLVFIASGVIILTLLLANFVIPLIAPRADNEDSTKLSRARALVYSRVIEKLSEMHDEYGDIASAMVKREYEMRLSRLDSDMVDNIHENEYIRQLRRSIFERQKSYLQKMVMRGEIDSATARQLRQEIKDSFGRSMRTYPSKQDIFSTNAYKKKSFSLRIFMSFFVIGLRRKINNPVEDFVSEDRMQHVRSLLWQDTTEFLKEICATDDDEQKVLAAESLLDERAATMVLLKERASNTGVIRMDASGSPDVQEMKKRQYEVESAALRFERAAIDSLWVRRKITRPQSLALRQELHDREMWLNEEGKRK
ncbi:MAG: Na+/H+ antiporter [Actinomycetaceae bacterium]|nr:Na+/H+ antiporter [Actinomycetaceae bacterium]